MASRPPPLPSSERFASTLTGLFVAAIAIAAAFMAAVAGCDGGETSTAGAGGAFTTVSGGGGHGAQGNTGAGVTGEISIPITVAEAVPAVLGDRPLDLDFEPAKRARHRALVSVGVPLHDGSNVVDTSGLGLDGADAGQFRVLHRYPSGNVRWVLASFLASVDAGGSETVTLQGGAGDFGGPPLASETDTHVVVDTGAATFHVPKVSFGLLDSVLLDGREMLAAAGDLVGTDEAGTEYFATRDPSPAVAIEENGPVKSVVRVRGHLVSDSGDALLAYLARLTFARESAGVGVDVTIANDELASPERTAFVSLTARMPLALESDAAFTFASQDDEAPFSGSLGPTERAHLFQGFTKMLGDSTYIAGDHPSSYVYPGDKFPLPGTDNLGEGGSWEYTVDPAYVGLQVHSAGQTLLAAGDDLSYTLGYADVRDEASNGVSAGYRWMAAYWPASFEVGGDGTFEVGLWSRHQPKPIALEWGGHMSRQVRLDFHRAEHDARDTLYALQYPLVGRAPFEQYRDTGALYGQRMLVTPEQEQAYFAKYGYERGAIQEPDFDEVVVRVHWRRNYRNHDEALLQFLRTGQPSWYLESLDYGRFFADDAVAHSADFDLLTMFDLEPGPVGQNEPDDEHQMSVSLPLLYFMSGDEALREGIAEYGEYLRWQENGRMPNYFSSERAWARNVHNFSWLYEFFLDDAYADVVRRCADFLIDSRDAPPDPNQKGRNLDRGYFHWRDRAIHSLFGTQIMSETTFNMLRLFRDYPAIAYGRIAAFEDALLGIAQFHFEEAAWRHDFFSWIIYDYLLDEPNPLSEPNDPESGDDMYDWYMGSRWLLMIYDELGDERWFEPYSAVSYGFKGTDGNNMRDASARFDQQNLFFVDLNRPAPRHGWREITDVAIAAQGGGSYTLSWIVPAGATAYRLKHADRAIVDWLGFDQMSRAYDVEPVDAVAWFAAEDVADAPTPLEAGANQTWTVTGLPDGQQFSLRYSVAPH